MRAERWALPLKKTLLYKERSHRKRSEYLGELRRLIQKFGWDNLIYIDETGFDAHSYRPNAWAPAGEKVIGERSGAFGKRTNLIAAKRGKEFLAPILYDVTTTALWFNEWLEKYLFKELRPNSVLILDNAAFHRPNDVKAIAEKAGHSVLFLPPYSPDYNPIEQDFAILKKLRSLAPANTTIDDIVKPYGFLSK